MSALHKISFRVYRLRWGAGLLIVAPLVLGTFWYAWSAFAQIDRYRRSAKDAPPLTLELFHLALHDELERDLRRVFLDERPSAGTLPTFELSLTRESLDQLTRPARDKRASYVKALVRKDGESHEARLRHRGGQHWHWMGQQKSMKVRVDRGDLLDGTRVFNLLNDVTPFGFEDQIILDLAREGGLLTPEYYAVWVRLNNSDMGVYRYEAQPEEGLLRRSRRMPGSMYSGDSEALRPGTQVGGLFWDRDGWSKVAWKSEDDKERFDEVERLLYMVTGASHGEFAAYARHEIDLDRYALFDALDVVFGGNDHDWFSNHKLYVDPYRGMLEPVAWSFRGFQHEPRLNLVDHPLLLRLKLTPGYLARRNRLAYELLTGKAAVAEIRARADRLFAALAPELEADPYWDAYKLLPRVTRFHRFMVRPMSTAKWLLAARAELAGFARRSRFLLDRLERPGLRVTSSLAPGGARVDVTVTGDAVYALRQVDVAAPCEGTFTVLADEDGNGGIGGAGEREVARGVVGAETPVVARRELAAGVRLVSRVDPQPKHGDVLAELEPRTFTYFVRAACAPTLVRLSLDNLTTNATSRVDTRPRERSAAPAASPRADLAASVPALVAGEVSPHPWDYPAASPPSTITLGPGAVTFAQTRVFGETERVRVVAGTRVALGAGTRVALGAGASLVFLGPVEVEGTWAAPVTVGRADPARAFGGIVLHGAATSGSRLRHLEVRGGSRARHGATDYPGLVNVHDTGDVMLADCTLVAPEGAEDVLHATYVGGLTLHELAVDGAPTDAVDLELTRAEVRGLRVRGAGDDCLDLMGAEVRLVDSILTGCTNNGISAGEETVVSAHGIVIGDARTAVLAKNASRARLSRSLVLRADTALETHRRELHYAGASAITADELYAVDCGEVSETARGTRVEPGLVRLELSEGSLEHVREHVLGISRWSELDERLSRVAPMEARP